MINPTVFVLPLKKSLTQRPIGVDLSLVPGSIA